METEAKAAAYEACLKTPIAGKSEELFSRLYEFSPSMVRAKIASYFGSPYQAPIPIETSDLPDVPSRPPTLCAGCPHRSTLYSVKKIAGEDTIYPCDIGCYGLAYIPPLSASDYCICMGSSISSACGISRTTGRKAVAFIGDSTFFHSGMTGLVDAVHNKHNILVVILDNGTTAMTGHQINPGMDTKPLGRDKQRIKPEDVVRGLGVQDIHVVRPRNLKKTQETVKAAMQYEGVSVIISEEVCPLFARRIGEFPKRPVFQVDQDRCKNHRDCINYLACPAFYLEGEKVMIDPDLCIGCAVCSQVCPENAIRPVKKGE